MIMYIFLSGLDGCGLWLRSLLDVSPPSVCGILTSDPSGSQMDKTASLTVHLTAGRTTHEDGAHR